MDPILSVVHDMQGVGSLSRALDAMRAGVAINNHYTVEGWARIHTDGSRCLIPEPYCAQPHTKALQWHEEFDNIVVTLGLNYLLDNSFGAVPGSVAAYVGLIGAGTGTVSITSGAAAVTGSGTSFANGDNGSELIIVGAGAAGADLITTVSGNPASGTALTAANNAGTTVSGAAYALEPRAADTMSSKSFNETAPYSNANRPTWTKNGAASGGAMSNSSSKASFTINATGRVFGAFMTTNNTVSGTTGTLYGGGLFTTGGSRSVISGDTVNVQVDLSATSA